MGFSPGAIGRASLIFKGAGVLSSTIGAYYKAKTQKALLRGQEAIARANARIAEAAAQSALIQGQRAVAAHTLRAGVLKSRQRAALAASGVDLGQGSPAEILASTDIMKEIDKGTIEANAMMAAFGHRTSAASYELEAMARRITGQSISPVFSAAGTLLGGATDVAATWYRLMLPRAQSSLNDPVLNLLGAVEPQY